MQARVFGPNVQECDHFYADIGSSLVKRRLRFGAVIHNGDCIIGGCFVKYSGLIGKTFHVLSHVDGMIGLKNKRCALPDDKWHTQLKNN